MSLVSDGSLALYGRLESSGEILQSLANFFPATRAANIEVAKQGILAVQLRDMIRKQSSCPVCGAPGPSRVYVTDPIAQ